MLRGRWCIWAVLLSCCSAYSMLVMCILAAASFVVISCWFSASFLRSASQHFNCLVFYFAAFIASSWSSIWIAVGSSFAVVEVGGSVGI